MGSVNFLGECVYAIVRVDLLDNDIAWQDKILVIKVVTTEQAAAEEVERLNDQQGPGGSFYFYKPTRLEGMLSGPSAGFSMN
jgi:hypothetical protein